ncbi:MAG: hypothetical protein QOJ65_2089 [Fimbriimonadaceae bacterium]|jgi:hypothetical protein|nr:hypothetical protein [Fimbriimonadaceae bacterium]
MAALPSPDLNGIGMSMRVTILFRKAAILLVCASTVAQAEGQEKLSTTVTLDLASKYVWHGVNLVNDWVVQPGVSFSTHGLTLALWGSMEGTDWNRPNYPRNPRGCFTDVEASLEYGKDNWKVGINDVHCPGTGEARYREWYAGLSAEQIWGAPELTVYTSGSSRTGTYAVLGLSHSLGREGKSLDLGAEITYGDKPFNDFVHGRQRAGFSDLQLSAGMTLSLSKGWSVTPSLHYSRIFKGSRSPGEPRQTNAWLSLGFESEL